MSPRNFRPSGSILVGLLATTGSAVAASLITSKQIKDGTIQTKDISKKARAALKGQRGATGATGAAGATGQQGPKGDKGDQGIQGIQGGQGIQGDQGIQGVPGPTAATGASDLPGVSLTMSDQVMVDLVDGNNQDGDQQINDPVRRPDHDQRDASARHRIGNRQPCNLQRADQRRHRADQRPDGPDGVQRRAGISGDQLLLPDGSVHRLGREAGRRTYNVRVVCREQSGDLDAQYAELVVWAAK